MSRELGPNVGGEKKVEERQGSPFLHPKLHHWGVFGDGGSLQAAPQHTEGGPVRGESLCLCGPTAGLLACHVG